MSYIAVEEKAEEALRIIIETEQMLLDDERYDREEWDSLIIAALKVSKKGIRYVPESRQTEEMRVLVQK